MATGVVSASSELVRKKWLREGLLQASSKSFWGAYTGMSSDSIVHQVNNESASDGHTVVFDYDGNLAGKAIKGKDTAYGKGEQKKKFSESITVDRYRLVVDNGDKFDAVNIGDLSISEHSDSRTKLADQFIRFKDQALFDAAQGFKGASASPHRIGIDASSTSLTYKNLADIELTLRTGIVYSAANPLGYQVGTVPDSGLTTPSTTTRAPLAPFRLQDGRSIWLMIVDPFTANNLRDTASNTVLNLATTADVRGNNNRIFKGLMGQVGQLLIVEAEAFFGSSDGGTGLDATDIEISGLRQYDGTNNVWSGDSSFASATHSRNLILGANALQIAFGRQPDYKFQASQDFGIKSESAVEFWMNTQKVNLTAENSDYSMAKKASMDNGVIAFDVTL